MAEINNKVTRGNYPLALVLDSLLTDLTNMRTSVNTIVTKLNSDGGVSDADYVSLIALTTTT